MFTFVTMNAYFIRLFNYDCHTNLKFADLMLTRPQMQEPATLMSHMLAAQQIWLQRCMDNTLPAAPVWPQLPMDSFREVIENNYACWIAFIEDMQTNAFERSISYTTSRGEKFENKLIDILTHVINHGTHHRAQIGRHLKLSGVELPVSDYILYIRDLESN